jgi:hypothetical protein
MVDPLTRIKRLILLGDYRFTLKARLEMEEDSITELEVTEAIINARRIDKTLRSENPGTGLRERLYVIKGVTFGNRALYTKGKIYREEQPGGGFTETFYILISSKAAT